MKLKPNKRTCKHKRGLVSLLCHMTISLITCARARKVQSLKLIIIDVIVAKNRDQLFDVIVAAVWHTHKLKYKIGAESSVSKSSESTSDFEGEARSSSQNGQQRDCVVCY